MKDLQETKPSTETGQLDKIKTALADILPEEHLHIIRQLREAEQGNPGSMPKNDGFTITYSGAFAAQDTKVPEDMDGHRPQPSPWAKDRTTYSEPSPPQDLKVPEEYRPQASPWRKDTSYSPERTENPVRIP